MPITEAQRVKRRSHLGSSDVAAVLGVNPWRSAYDVWAEKTGRLDDAHDDSGEAATLGQQLEDGVLSQAEHELGKLTRRGTERRVKGTPILSHIDALIEQTKEPVEAKTSGITGPVVGEWGEAGTDAVPQYYLVQCVVHMMATEKEICHLAALLGGRGYVRYVIPHHQQLNDIIGERCVEFWSNNVQKDMPPSAMHASLDVAKAIRRTPGKWAKDIDPALVQWWEKAREKRLEYEKMENKAKAAVLASLDDAEGAVLEDGRHLTYLPVQRQSIDTKALKADRPDIAEYYAKTTEYRKLTIKKGESG